MGELRFIDFFAGIGGMRHGLELAGHKCLGFCEIDKYAIASYTMMYLATQEQRERLSDLSMKKRQGEILGDEYKNGEWYADDIRNITARDLPDGINCYTFGSPCQQFSVAGTGSPGIGLTGERSGLVREVFRILDEQQEKDRPEWLIHENVKGMFAANKGLDYLSIISEMDRLGYDVQWQNLNSAWFVPQNRERIYTIGHLRRYGTAKVLPIEGTDGENSVSLIAHRKNFRRSMQVYDHNGITETLITEGGSGHIPFTYQFCDLVIDGHLTTTDKARTLLARYYKGATYTKNANSGVLIKFNDPEPDNHEPRYVKFSDGTVAYAIWYEKYNCYIAIRRMTPKECFRLQGFPDYLFERAESVNSDSQLYKQAGNAVTVNVAEAVGKKIMEC